MPQQIFAFPYKGLDLKIRGSITETYDDNINFVSNDKKGDSITALSLGINAAYEGKRRFLNLAGNINQSFHQKYSDIKRSSENINLRFQNEFSEYDTINISYEYFHSYYPATFEEEFGRVNSRQNSYDHAFNIIYKKIFSERISSDLKYIYKLSIRPEETLSDSTFNGIGINVHYLHSRATTLYISFTASDTKYKDGGDIGTQSIAAGFKKYITRQLVLDARAGLVSVAPETGKKDVTQSIEASLTDEIDQNTTAIISFEQQDEASSDREDVFRNWQLTGSLQKELSDKIIGSFVIFYGKGKNIRAGDTTRFLGANTSITYELTEHLSGQMQYRYSNLDSTIENSGYAKNIMSLGLVYVF